MRILITGGAGFIGSHLADRLVHEGHHVELVDDLSLGRRSNVAHLIDAAGVPLHELCILSDDFDRVVEKGRFDAVFHMAANSDIQAGSRDRRVDLERTFLTTFHTCEAAARHGVGQLWLASTSAIYGDVDADLHEDFGPLVPISFYGAAKLASEAYAAAFAHRCDIKTWSFRFPNVIGPRATHGVIYDFIGKLRKTPQRLDVLGDGSQEKPYLHVSDLIDAMMSVWDSVDAPPYVVHNISAQTFTNVRAIAEIVVELTAPGAEIVYGTEPRGWPGDVPKFRYDTSKIEALGWRPSRSSDQAVRDTVRALLDAGF